VINTNGIAFYQFDSSFGATCFGDQPHVGYDDNALYISTDEFCGPGQNTYAGALLVAISKPQLVSEAPKVNAQIFGLLSLGGIPILTLEPAVTVGGANTEYLLNSFPMDAAGNNLPSSNNLGFWSVTNDQAITTGSGSAVLTGKTITSETYFFPVPAASTGTGATSNVCGFIPGACVPVQSEAVLNPDDDRMLQVEAFNQNGKIHLWAALDSALNIVGDTSTRDAAAWFRIDASSQSVVQQGFVASKGNNLLYPAIFHSNSGATTMTFTLTGPSRNPSAAWTNLDLAGSSSPAIHIAGFGSSAHVSFSDVLPPAFGPRPRWGDYSAAVLDPDNNGIWMATEYIPPRHDQDPLDNWGTYVFEAA
jgi:hypothetical protein